MKVTEEVRNMHMLLLVYQQNMKIVIMKDDYVEQIRKLKNNRVVRKTGNSQSLPSSKQAQDNQSDQSGSKN